jgi:acetyl esterase/lipase
MADHRLSYGSEPFQYGDLWMPPTATDARLPLVVFFHGGWWKSKYDLTYAGHLCAALKNMEIAVWSVEYRRVGETGGGWPTTFEDVALGLDYVRMLAEIYPLDLGRVITVGHSAGGQLAFWAAGCYRVPSSGQLKLPPPQVKIIGTIALAGAVGLRLVIELSGASTFAHDRDEVYALMGGTPEDLPERYKLGDPAELLPLRVPQILIQGMIDDQIPPDLPALWAVRARDAGDFVQVEIVPSADHLDVADPDSRAWPIVATAVSRLLSPAKKESTSE